jgi:hypothetical protein
MRRMILILALLFAVPLMAGEPNWANKFFVKTGEKVPEVIPHDFGVLPKGTVKTHTFAMTNIYAVPLKLTQPKASCGCVTVTEYTGKLEPMETGYIKIQIDTAKVDGKKTVKLPVTFSNTTATGEHYESTADLEIRADIRSEVRMEPGQIEFNTVAFGEALTKTTNLTYTGRMRGWTIKSVPNKLLDIEVVNVNVRGAISYNIAATIKKDAPSGQISEEIILKTNDPATPEIRIPVTGKIEAPYSLNPGNTVRLKTPVDVETRQHVIMSSSNGKMFKIAKVEGAENGFTLPLVPVAANKTQTFTVYYTPKKVEMVTQELTLTLDNGDKVKLTVHGTGVEAKKE